MIIKNKITIKKIKNRPTLPTYFEHVTRTKPFFLGLIMNIHYSSKLNEQKLKQS